MKPRNNAMSSSQGSKHFQDQGPNWILIAGGALLSTLSVRLGYKLKQVLDAKQPENSISGLKGNGKVTDRKRSENSRSHSNLYCFPHDERCFNCSSGTEGVADIKPQSNGQIVTEPDMALPLTTVSAPEYSKSNGVLWATSPDRLELPQKPFHHSNSSDSPCVSESGSDIFSKREVIQKLRQQLKRRDDMILEMQDQIAELQNSLSAQLSHSTHLQSLLDAANRDLFDSEREIQRLRKAIADHCVGQVVGPTGKHSNDSMLPSDGNGYTNGYIIDVEGSLDSSEKGRVEAERIEMLKREVVDLKEAIEGKDYLLRCYKEQKSELSLKVKELQQRLDSQVPNIL